MTRTGLAMAVQSGFIHFARHAAAYVPDSFFYVRMLVMLLAIIATGIVQGNVPKWAELPIIPAAAKLAALASLLAWIGTILSGVEIPAFTGVG